MGKASRARRARQAEPAAVPRPRDLPQPPPPVIDPLADIDRKSRQIQQLERQVDELVRLARARGCSWDQIARASGRNRETLRRNFGSPDA